MSNTNPKKELSYQDKNTEELLELIREINKSLKTISYNSGCIVSEGIDTYPQT